MNEWRTSWSMLRWRECMAKSNGYCRRNPMAEKVKVWFDPEGDFLEVRVQ
jgi:hypothetical protein